MMIIAPRPSTLLSALCRQHQMWGMYASLCGSNETHHEEVLRAAPWASEGTALWNLTLEGCVFLFFSTEEEMRVVYLQTVGGDGPTETNTYNGPARVYALTCDPTGQTHNENT